MKKTFLLLSFFFYTTYTLLAQDISLQQILSHFPYQHKIDVDKDLATIQS